VLEVSRLTRRFGGLIAVKELTFQVSKGEIVGLIGPNGAGKTTVINLITGIYKPDSGIIRFNGENIGGLPPHEIRRRGLSRTFQIPRPFLNLTVLENVMVAGYFGSEKSRKENIEDYAIEILEFFGLEKRAKEFARNLTLYERRMLELARALMAAPRMLLIDECAAGLNPVEIDMMCKKVKEIHEKGITMLIVEHVLRFLFKVVNRVIVMHYGEKISEGKPEEISKDPKVIEAYMGRAYALEG
jgi:branched-chain amino acid transport system ATP-binding protein